MRFLIDTTAYGAMRGLLAFLWGAIRNAIIVGLAAMGLELGNYPLGDNPMWYGLVLGLLIAAVAGIAEWLKQSKPYEHPEPVPTPIDTSIQV